jgi:hypothetical protein
MARQKRKSPVLQTARERLAGLKQCPDKPDFGPALSVEAYEAEIKGYATDEDGYNQELAALDDKQNRLEAREQGLHDLNLRILAAIKAQFGPDSSEFELVGGTRRQRPQKSRAQRRRPSSQDLINRQTLKTFVTVEAKRGTSTVFFCAGC